MGFTQTPGVTVTLIATNIAPALAAAIANRDSRWATLGKLAATGTRRSVSQGIHIPAAALRAWQTSIVEVAGLAGREREFPSAALTRSGDAQELTHDAWAQLECVHFAASLNDLAGVQLHGDTRLNAADREELAITLGEHLRADGFDLQVTAQGDWLLRLPRALDVQTVAPEIAFRGPLDRALPRGADAAMLRRLMTELQMLLHEHPVNLRRARAGLPAANAVWIWGTGAMTYTRSAEARLPTAYGAEAYLKGFYLLHEMAVRAETFSLDVLRDKREQDILVLVESDDLDAFESQWLVPLTDALKRGWIQELRVHLDSWRLEARRGDLFRFWRSPRAPHEWSE